MALSANVARNEFEFSIIEYPVASGEVIYAGAIVALEAGYAVAGKEALNLRVKGIAKYKADNSTGQDGDISVVVMTSQCGKGVRAFPVQNDSAPNAADQSDVGSDVYLKDDTTISTSSNSSARSLAGELVGFDEHGLPLVAFNI